MKNLLSELQLIQGLTPEQARLVARNMIIWTRTKAREGQVMDFGHMKVFPVNVKPRPYPYNVGKTPEHKGKVFVGERTKWKVAFRSSWLRLARPFWSKF